MSNQSSVTTKLILSWLAMIVIALLSGATSSAQGQPSDASGVTAVNSDQQGPIDPVEFEAFLDAFLLEQMEEHHIPGVVFTMVKDGELFFAKGYGYADLEARTPFDPEETVLTTASLAKVFAALGVLQLYEQSIINLDEDIRPYFTDFQLDTVYDEPLTFAHLLTHTDGFEMRMIGGGALSEDALLPLGALLETYMPPQIYPPGKYLTYSDFAANLAGYATAEITGIPFEQYMAENILIPLGMVDSTLDVNVPPDLRPRLASGYDYQNGQYERMPFFFPRYGPSGGLRTTAADMNHFMLALLGGGEYQGTRILEEATTQLMFTRQFSPHPNTGGISYGLFEHLENGQRLFLRDGDGVGTRSRTVLFPDQDLGFFISYNSGDSHLRHEIISAFLDRYYPAEGSGGPRPMAGYRERAPQFSGTYRILQADTTTFGKSMFFFAQWIEVQANDKGYLVIEATDGDAFGGFEGTSQWLEVEPLYFERVDGHGQLAFSQDDQGNINQLVSGQGYHGTFDKLAWYETRRFHLGLMALVAVFLLSMVMATFVVWPLDALIRRLRKQTVSTGYSWASIVAWLWAGLVSALLAFFLVQAIGVLYAIDAIHPNVPNFYFGVTDAMVSALNNLYLPAALALALPIFAVLAWWKSWWRMFSRMYYTLVTLAVFAGIWWLHFWNLLGLRI